MNKKTFNFENMDMELNKNEVHIWHFDLDKFNKDKTLMEKILSQDELSRANAFHFEKDRKNFVCGRGLLRLLISKYSGISPELINLEYGDFGKPVLKKTQNSNSIYFNLSHSGDFIVFGFTLKSKIGIDIEFLEPKPDLIELAEKYFSLYEYKILDTLSEEQKIEAFYNCWTRKEAFIKAIGKGLSFPLKSFAVSLTPGEETKIVKFPREERKITEDLFLDSFEDSSHLVGAVAVLGVVNKVKHFKLDDHSLLLAELTKY